MHIVNRGAFELFRAFEAVVPLNSRSQNLQIYLFFGQIEWCLA